MEAIVSFQKKKKKKSWQDASSVLVRLVSGFKESRFEIVNFNFQTQFLVLKIIPYAHIQLKYRPTCDPVR
jgi:hypothetical protein